jgi:hypothetical protein
MIRHIQENPISGNGVNFATTIRGHNTIIGVWADSGIIVFLLFIVLLISHWGIALTEPDARLRGFTLAVLTVLSVFMMTLQTIINQGYLLAIFVYLGYMLEKRYKLPLTKPKVQNQP